jgi:hypothetical protein
LVPWEAGENVYPGINDALGGYPTGAKFNSQVLAIFQAWHNSTDAQRASIERAEKLMWQLEHIDEKLASARHRPMWCG